MKVKYGETKDVLAGVAGIFTPPDRVRPSEAANKHFRLPEGGMFDVSVTPYMREPMDIAASRLHTSVIFAGPARSGKTLSLLDGVISWLLTCNPSDSLVVHMTEASARKYSRMRVARLIRNSPKISKLLTANRDDDNILFKSFRNGMNLVIASPAPTNLSASDYKFVMLSDYDRMSDDNGEGDIFLQAQKRTQTFMSAGMTLAESSPGRDFVDNEWKPSTPHEAPPVSGILGLYNDGDRRLWQWTHADCGGSFLLKPGLDLFCLPKASELLEEIDKSSTSAVSNKYARIHCPCCGAEIDEKQKTKMNNSGVWVKEHPDSHNTMASFWLSGVAAKFQTWQSILDKYMKALVHYDTTGEEEKLKAVMNVDIGAPFIPFGISSKLTAKELEDRAEDFEKRTVPFDGRALFASIDVQGGFFAVYVECKMPDGSNVVIDRFDIRRSKRMFNGERAQLDPAGYIEDWDILIDEVIQMRYPIEDTNLDMGMTIVTCDSGGKEGVTENAYRFSKKMKSIGLASKFHLIKGERPKPDANKPAIFESIMDKSSSAARAAGTVGSQKVWILNTTVLKDAVSANLRRATPGIDQYRFPDWLPTRIYKEITVEIRTDKGWENMVRQPNETFDLMAYAKAAFMIKKSKHGHKELPWGGDLPYWLGEHDINPEVAEVGKFAVVAPRRRRERKVRMRIKR